MVIQKQKQAFSFNAFKAEIHIAGKPVNRIAVEGGMGDPGKTRNESVPQGRDSCGVFCHMCTAFLQRRSHAHGGGDIFRSSPSSPFLGAAFDEVCQGNALPGI